MRNLSVRIPAALLYLFIAFLVYLAGIYVSIVYYFVYVVLMLLPVVSIIQIVVTYPAIAIDEKLDADSPTRGTSVRYRVTVTNRSILPSGRIRITFAPIHPEMAEHLPDLSISLPGHGRVARELPVMLPYRGIYAVGIDSFVMSDLFGWLTLTRRVHGRSFVVYPRLLELDPSPLLRREQGGAVISSAGRDGDLSLFEGLSPYRVGFPAKQIAWKKFLSTGTPFLKDYGSSHRPGVTIYLDLRRGEAASPALLEAEDSSIEIALALYRYFLDRRTATCLRVASAEESVFRANGSEGLFDFYRASVSLRFGGATSPISLYADDRMAGGLTATVIFVTHLFDLELLTLLGSTGREHLAAIVNTAAMSAGRKNEIERGFGYLGNGEGRLLLVEGAGGLREAMRR